MEVPVHSLPGKDEFPNGRTVRGRYYQTITPSDEQVVIMSLETWGDWGTTLESLRQLAKAQDSRIKELIAAAAAAGAKQKDAEDRLEALRDVRRREMRADYNDGKLVLTP
jgi:hypothetical protein